MTPASRLDSGNRSFLLLLGVVAAFRATVTVLACCVGCVVGFQLVTAGPAALWSRGGWMLPAALLAGLLAGLLAATTVAVVVRAARSLWADAALRRRLRTRTAGGDGVEEAEEVEEAAARHGLAGRVRVIDDTAPFAFTYGYLRPTIAVSGALVRTLNTAELTAVVAHESAHLRGRDPLKVLLARLLVSREFYLPALRHLSARFIGGRELAADRHAAATCGVRPLAGALLRVVDSPNWAAATPATAMASAATLDTRISQLETGTEPTPPTPPPGSILVSVTVGVLVLAAAVDAAIVVQQLCMRAM